MPKLVNDDRLKQAVDVLLTMQNEDGGFASYERIRGPQWLEWFNTAEVFSKSASTACAACAHSSFAPPFQATS
jgi:squalene cyclase